MKRYIEIFKTLTKIDNTQFGMIIQMFISSALNNIASLLPPIATSGIIGVITKNNFDGIWLFVVLYAVFYVIYFTTLHWNYYVYSVLGSHYHIEVQRKILDKVANNDEIFSKVSKGKIVATCSDDIRYLVDVADCFVEAIMNIIKLLFIFVIFMKYNMVVASIVLLFDFIYIITMNNNSKKVSKYYEGTRKYEDKIIDILNQMLTNLRQVKTLNLMPNLNKNLDKTRNRWRDAYKGKRDNMTVRYCTIPYLVYSVKIVLYIFMAYLVINKKMTLDKLVLLISYFEMTITCTDTMLDNLLDLSNYSVRVNRIKNILDFSGNSLIGFGDVYNDYINGLVEFKNVCFGAKGKNILNNVSFKAYPNEINTIIGHSGSGKTTIINLLYRLYRIDSGSILIDGENIYNYNSRVYATNVSGVFQKPFIFDMSIKDNLSLVDSNIDNQINACKRVGLHDFIMSLPRGYNTILRSDVKIFSDGQKQLLVIARALLSKAEILLFDEVTSNIDADTTDYIAKLLQDLKTDHTIIMITHKSEIMDVSDRIIVLDKGKVKAKGKNKEVYDKCEIYRKLKNRTFASVSNVDN